MNNGNPRVVILLLTTFKNDSRVLKEGRSLAGSGYAVTIVALSADDLPDRERLDGIEVVRLRLRTRNLPKSRAWRVIKYAEYGFRVARNFRKADILHCCDLETLPVGIAIKLLCNRDARVLYDAHELETEQRPGQGRMGKKILSFFERVLARRADGFITVGESIAEEYRNRYRIPKPEVVMNCPPRSSKGEGDLFRQELGIPRDSRIYLYQGGLQPERGIENIVEAFRGLEIRESAEEHGNIYFREAVPPDALATYTASADFGFLLYENSCLNNYYCLPNKFFEYIMAGIPVIVSDLFEIGRIVRTWGIGIVLESLDPPHIREAADEIERTDVPALRSRFDELRSIYNWKNQEQKLLEVYGGLTGP
jgi:glycosyltransferase involved in cell wall biosynthesis